MIKNVLVCNITVSSAAFEECCDAFIGLQQELGQDVLSRVVLHTRMFQLQRLAENGDSGVFSRSAVLQPSLTKP
jgi:hypothetical protein